MARRGVSDSIARDDEGYLLDPEDWSREWAFEIARETELTLGAEHWIVIELIRAEYADRQTVPEARRLLKLLRLAIGESKATRQYLYTLFPYGYGPQACIIAGMRKPLKLMLDV